MGHHHSFSGPWIGHLGYPLWSEEQFVRSFVTLFLLFASLRRVSLGKTLHLVNDKSNTSISTTEFMLTAIPCRGQLFFGLLFSSHLCFLRKVRFARDGQVTSGRSVRIPHFLQLHPSVSCAHQSEYQRFFLQLALDQFVRHFRRQMTVEPWCL